ncbi:FAD-binding protein [Desulfitobacterium hafniense]|uniref:FAD-binding protein n=1 Tax=Desulfitobacterium hafniense TaxID=49338 RepID=UPI001FA7B689|nr:FAD-binding protein [Desulfitobacterium hafniense]
MEFRSSRRDQQGFVVEANLNAALAKGAKIFYGCFGTKLLKDDKGRVTGIIVRDAKNSKYLQFNADRGVVLATGDNAGDEKILRHFAPEVIEKGVGNMGAMGMLGKDVEGNPVDTGDGLRMGAWLGAKVQDYHAPMTHHMGSGMGVTPFLQLNKHGERFMNEDIPGQQLHNQIELQPELTSFQIFDSDWGKQIPFMAPAHGGLCYIIPEDEDESNPNFADRQYTKLSAKKRIVLPLRALPLRNFSGIWVLQGPLWKGRLPLSSVTTNWPKPAGMRISAKAPSECSPSRRLLSMPPNGVRPPCLSA